MAYDSQNPSGMNQDSFNAMRNQAQQRASGQQSANYQALQRRFANNGGMNSGAAIQAESEADRGTQQDLENTQGNIGFEQEKENVPFQMQKNQQDFQSQQAEKERALKQDELAQRGTQMQQQESQFEKELPLKSRQLDLEASQQGMDRQAMEFNEGLSQWSQEHSGGLLGAGGFLGTGIGAGGKFF